MAGSDYFIRVALDPSSLAKVRQQLLALGREAATLAAPAAAQGSAVNRQVVEAASGLTRLYQEQAVAAKRAQASVTTGAQVSASAVEQSEGRKRRAVEQTAQASRAADLNRSTTAQSLRDAARQEAQAQREVQQARRAAASLSAPVPVERTAGTGMAALIAQQRAAAASSSPLVRALGSLNAELNSVGGSAFGAGNALARGTLNMRQLAAATVETAARLTFWSAGAAAIFGVVEVLRQVKEAALDADEAMINLSRVVVNPNRVDAGGSMIGHMREMALGAKDVGAAYFEMGKLMDSQEEAVKGAETVLIATKIAELDVAEASQQLVKVQRAYGLGAEDLESVLDRLNDQQNRLGVDIGKSLMGVSRAAGVTRNAGGELDALVARMTVLQKFSGFAPETVSRINQRMAIQLTTLKGQQRVAAALKPANIELLDRQGVVKGIDELLSEIGAKFKDLPSTVQSEIATALTGGTQGGLSSGTTTLLQMYAEVDRQTRNVANSQGSAREELDKTMKSARNQLALVGTEIQAIGVNLANSGILEVLGLMTRALQEALEIVNDMLGAFNRLPEVLRVSLIGVAALRGAAGLVRGFRGGVGGAVVGAAASAAGIGGVTAARGAQSATVAAASAARMTAGLEAAARGFQQMNAQVIGATRAERAHAAAMAVRTRLSQTSTASDRAATASAQRYILARNLMARQDDRNVTSVTRMMVAMIGVRDAANQTVLANQNARRGFQALNAAQYAVVESTRMQVAATQAQFTANTRNAAAMALATRAQGPGLLSRAGGVLGSGAGMLSATLLASIVGDVVREQGKESGNARVERGGQVLQGVGTGALIGSIFPGVGTAVGAGVGGAIGGIVALYRSQSDAQREATDSLGTLTSAAHALREAQERAARGISESAEKQQASPIANLAESADAANRFTLRMQEAETRLGQSVIAARLEEQAQTMTVLDDKISRLEDFRSTDPTGFSASRTAGGQSSDEALRGLTEVRDAINAGREAQLTTNQLLAASPISNARDIFDQIGAPKNIPGVSSSRLAGDITTDEDEIRRLLRQGGVTGAAQEAMIRDFNAVLLEELTEHVAGTVDAPRSEAISAAQILARQLSGRLGIEQQFAALNDLSTDLTTFYDAAQTTNDPNASKVVKDQAQKQLEEARTELEAESQIIADIYGESQSDFLKGLDDIVSGTNSDIIARITTEVMSARNAKLEQTASGQAQQILNANSSEEILGIVETSVLTPEAYVDNINNMNTRLQLGTIRVQRALELGLAQVTAAYAEAQSNPNDAAAQELAAQTQQAFQSMIQMQVDGIRAQMEAGQLSPEQGASRILAILAQIENQRANISPGLRTQNLTAISTAVQSLISDQAENIADDARTIIRETRNPAQRQRRQRALNNALRLLRSAAGGGGNTQQIVRALRAIGIAENVIALIEQASATTKFRAQRQKLRDQRDAALIQLNTARNTLRLAQNVAKDGFQNILRIRHAMRQVNAAKAELARLDKAMANLANSQQFDPGLAEALNAGFSEGAEAALSNLGQETLAPENSAQSAADAARQAREEAQRRAEEARERQMDLISARFEFLKALAGDDPVRIARLDLEEQQELARFARSRAERFRARAAIINARRALRDAILDQANGGNSFGTPNEIRIPTAYEVRAMAGRAMRGANAGMREGGMNSRTEVSMTAHNRNSITIVVSNKRDLDRVAETISTATGADEQAMKSIGFSGGGLL